MTPTEVVAARVRELRERQGWSGRELAERCQAAGGAGAGLDRSVIANLENGRRRSVSIDEVLVLAAVLNVAPVHLFVPVEEAAVLVGGWTLGAGRVREWVRGRYPLPSQDSKRYRTEVPDEEWQAFEAARPMATPEEFKAFMERPAAPELEEE